jgi:hypothetical protein
MQLTVWTLPPVEARACLAELVTRAGDQHEALNAAEQNSYPRPRISRPRHRHRSAVPTATIVK